MSRWASHRRSPYLPLRSFIASILRAVPATRSPRARSCSVIRRPKPLFTPVISQVLDLRFGFIFFLCFFLLILFYHRSHAAGSAATAFGLRGFDTCRWLLASLTFRLLFVLSFRFTVLICQFQADASKTSLLSNQ